MVLHLDPKAWYQFIKHSLCPTAHNETVNRAIQVLLHCITSFSAMNVAKIILQEIQACSKNKDDMICFPCLISTLCKRKGVQLRLVTPNMI